MLYIKFFYVPWYINCEKILILNINELGGNGLGFRKALQINFVRRLIFCPNLLSLDGDGLLRDLILWECDGSGWETSSTSSSTFFLWFGFVRTIQWSFILLTASFQFLFLFSISPINRDVTGHWSLGQDLRMGLDWGHFGLWGMSELQDRCLRVVDRSPLMNYRR